MRFRATFIVIAMLGVAAPIAVALAAGQTGATGNADATATLARLQAEPAKPGDATAGQSKAAVCGACHGADGNSLVPMYPKLAGQSEAYMVAQLMRFKSGVRSNAIMAPMAAPLSVQDMHDLGAWFAGQKRSPGVADEHLVADGGKLYREGDASRGIPACAACHGADGAGNPGWRAPDIAGQHASYVQQVLQAWHDGASWGDDAHASIMPTIAKRLTAQDITAVSSYIQGLHAAADAAPAADAGQN